MAELWLEELNPRQREAAEFGDGQLLIVAGAGSGKTRVIVHRIAHLISSRGVEPYHILAVTFTNKAAEEMQARVLKLLGPEAGRVWVSTFHSLGAQILRTHAERLGYTRSFVIYDDADQLSLLKKVLREEGYDPKQVNPKVIRWLIDGIKREALPDSKLDDHPDPRVHVYLPVIRKYQERLKEANALDFADLLLLTYRLFAQFPEVLEQYRDRFRYVMVDEYQDTNRVQYLLVRQIAGDGGNICVVGDEDQSIYGWRGADIGNILSFEQDFPGARVVMLEQNYRSSRTIIEAASALIGNNRERKPKKLWTDNPDGARIRLFRAADEQAEARWVVEEALREKGMGRSLDDMAIFYRTHAQSRLLEDALRSLNLAYSVYGGTRFYDRKEIKDVIAYLKVIDNPADEVSLMRIINVPVRGIGDKTVEAVEKVKRERGGDWIEAVKQGAGGVGAKARAGLMGFARMMEELKLMNVGGGTHDPLGDRAGDSGAGSVTALVEAVIEKSGYRKMLEEEGSVEAAARIENLEELINAVADYEKTTDAPSLRGFLEKVSLATDIDGFDPASGKLTLMTLHSAKGLEFPAVFIVGMEEGVFPHQRSLDDELNGDDAGAVEEERRLCYVGMTRAKELLCLSCAGERSILGLRQAVDQSRFIAEIPGRFLQQVGPLSPLRRPPLRRGRGRGVERGAPVRRDFGDSEIIYDTPSPDSFFTSESGTEFHPGDRVYHREHGEGVIRRFEESGERIKVVVRFAHGTKKFLARFVKLEPLD